MHEKLWVTTLGTSNTPSCTLGSRMGTPLEIKGSETVVFSRLEATKGEVTRDFRERTKGDLGTFGIRRKETVLGTFLYPKEAWLGTMGRFGGRAERGSEFVGGR